MGFTFLHTGDWHIAKSFGQFDVEYASQLRAQRLSAIGRLADAARAGGAGDILVAGDVFDHGSISALGLREVLARLKGSDDLNWHIIPGNHDPGEYAGVWDRLTAIGLPENVSVYLDAVPQMLRDDVMLLPSPIVEKRLARDPTEWMDDVPVDTGVMRIGLAHGPAMSFSFTSAATAFVDPERTQSAHLDYLALGDWHGMKQIGPRVWYAGTPEPDQFAANDPGHALLVRLEAPGRLPAVEVVDVAHYRWLKRSVSVTTLEDIAAIEREIGDLGQLSHQSLLELRLEGELSLSDDAELDERLEHLAARLFYLRRRSDGLQLSPRENELRALGDDVLEAVAERLAGIMSSGEAREAVTAERAMRRLFTLARASDREQ